jgi:sulfur carrier protein ThiS
MKITVETLGLPTLFAAAGRKVEVEMPGGTVADLLRRVTEKYGERARRVLLDAEGNLDYTIQVMVNQGGFVPHEEMPRHELKDGDSVKLMLLVGGG